MTSDEPNYSKVHAWMQLLRPPNLFSVPGDVVAGFALAGGGIHAIGQVKNLQDYRITLSLLLPLCLASLFVYLFGLISNDLADLTTDRIERPQRPLPSGRVSLTSARVAAILCAMLALAHACVSIRSFFVCLLLIAVVTLYNFWFKRFPFLGAGTMALCRALNVVLGISIVSWSPFGYTSAGIFALAMFLYVFGVTRAAKDETLILTNRPGRFPILIGAAIAYLNLFLVVIVHKTDSVPMLISGAISAISAALFVLLAYWGFRIFKNKTFPSEAQRWIGLLIWNLIFAQAAAVAARGWIFFGVFLLFFAYLANRTAKKFYGS